jgi:hypothetical protein
VNPDGFPQRLIRWTDTKLYQWLVTGMNRIDTDSNKQMIVDLVEGEAMMFTACKLLASMVTNSSSWFYKEKKSKHKT